MGSTLDGFPDFFQHAVTQLMAACPGSSIASGARTTDEQAHLYKTKGAWSPSNPGAAAPGTSNHEVGVGSGAADMSGNLECLHEKAAAFGLHFPMSNEPWHIEPTDELIEAGMEFFGMAEEPEDSLASLRSIIFGQGGPENPVDVPERVSQAFAPEADPAASEAGEFVPEASAGFTPGDGKMSAVEVAQVYAQAGFTGEALVHMVAISQGESGHDPGATGDTSLTNGTWGPSMGLSQIRSLNEQRGTGGWRDAERLSDPLFNARAAYAISNGGTNFSPWTVWNEGIYKKYLDEAQAAVKALGAYGGSGPPAASVPPDDDLDVDVAAGLMDPAGLSAEIAEMMLAQRKGSPLERVEDVASENEIDKPKVSSIGGKL